MPGGSFNPFIYGILMLTAMGREKEADEAIVRWRRTLCSPFSRPRSWSCGKRVGTTGLWYGRLCGSRPACVEAQRSTPLR